MRAITLRHARSGPAARRAGALCALLLVLGSPAICRGFVCPLVMKVCCGGDSSPGSSDGSPATATAEHETLAKDVSPGESPSCCGGPGEPEAPSPSALSPSPSCCSGGEAAHATSAAAPLLGESAPVGCCVGLGAEPCLPPDPTADCSHCHYCALGDSALPGASVNGAAGDGRQLRVERLADFGGALLNPSHPLLASLRDTRDEAAGRRQANAPPLHLLLSVIRC